MTQSPLRCRTSIIRSSALVQASSSLSMGRTRAWPWSSSITEIYFRHFLREFFCVSCILAAPGDPHFKELHGAAICNTSLQSYDVCYSAMKCLQCDAYTRTTCTDPLQCPRAGSLQFVAVCCSVLQCVVVCRSVFQCVAMCCNVL